MEQEIFDISFESGGQVYKGWVNPSEKLNDTGAPSSYHVVLNEVSFGYLSFNDCKWTINEERPTPLVKAVGEEIEKLRKSCPKINLDSSTNYFIAFLMALIESRWCCKIGIVLLMNIFTSASFTLSAAFLNSSISSSWSFTIDLT